MSSSTPDATPPAEDATPTEQATSSKEPKDSLSIEAQIEAQLRNLLGGGLGSASQPKKPHAEWVKLLYLQYTADFLNDNNRIWTTATIFIPLSLAGLISLKDLSLYNTSLLGIGSCLLMGFWVIIADHHRAFQSTSKKVIKAVEEHIGFPFKGEKFDRSGVINFKLFYTVQRVRYLMFWCVVGVWLLAIGGKMYDYYARRPIPLVNFFAYHAVSADSTAIVEATAPATKAPAPSPAAQPIKPKP